MDDPYGLMDNWPKEDQYEPHATGYRPGGPVPSPLTREDVADMLWRMQVVQRMEQQIRSPLIMSHAQPARRGPDPWTVVGWAVAGMIGTGVLLAVAVVAVAMAASVVAMAVAAGILYLLMKGK